jgi:hypothetical protein
MVAATNKSARDAKRQRREAAREVKLEAKRERAAQRRRRSVTIYGAVALFAAVLAGLFGWSMTRPKPGERIAGQGQVHISAGQPHPAYNSNPPTSGWHMTRTASWGAFQTEIPDEIVVHNLEHGGIWISYKDPSDAALVEKLEALVSRFRSKVIVTPRSRNDSRVVVAAWERLLKLETYDEKRIVEFINAYRNKGPERVPD